jgi:hypothetical protein
MERLWSLAGATRQPVANEPTPKTVKTSKTVAVGCDPLPLNLDGKEGVDGSSPSEGFPSLRSRPKRGGGQASLGTGLGTGQRSAGAQAVATSETFAIIL